MTRDDTTGGEATTQQSAPPPPPRRRSWRDALVTYTRPHILIIGLLGFASGLPLALTGATLSLWLAQEGINKSTIGLFASVGMPYTLKFLWAPFVDRVRLPGLVRLFGQRRGWLLAVQLVLAAAILALGTADPSTGVMVVAGLALAVATLSATQDIIIDGYRVALLPPEEQGHGSAIGVLGYRLGMLASAAGALFVVSVSGWAVAYAVMAGLLVAIGVVATLMAREPQPLEAEEGPPGLLPWMRDALWTPLADFATRRHWVLLLVFVGLYRIGDSVAGAMAMPLYHELGFTAAEIASITKVVGLIALIMGGLLGGLLLNRMGILRGLLVCGVLQGVSNLGFAGLAMVGHRLDALGVVIVLENLAAGMGGTALVAMLAVLCNVRFAATQYALLSAAAASVGRVVSMGSGFVAEATSWPTYFVLTTIVSLPSLGLLFFFMRRPPPELQRDVRVKPGDAADAGSATDDVTAGVAAPVAGTGEPVKGPRTA